MQTTLWSAWPLHPLQIVIIHTGKSLGVDEIAKMTSGRHHKCCWLCGDLLLLMMMEHHCGTPRNMSKQSETFLVDSDSCVIEAELGIQLFV